MQEENREMYACLIEWLALVNGESDANKFTPSYLSNGMIFALTLHQIDPSYFSEERLLSKIKQDVDTNWRLKVSNLRKIVDFLYNYYIDMLGLLNLSDALKPDVGKIGEKTDKHEIGKLVQLILGCAVNCAEKEKYITQIMDLEEDLQRNIMKAIQSIEYIWQNCTPPRSLPPAVDSKAISDERDNLAQRCHESELQISALLEEKSTLLQEVQKLQQLVDRLENPSTVIGDDGTSLGPIQAGSARYNELRKQCAELKDDLLQAETAKDDLKMKCIQQEQEIVILQAKIEDLHHQSSEVAALKDEIDALRETNEKVKIYEQQLAVYKKKMDDYNDMKKQIKLLEERSAEYLKQNMQHEDDVKKYSGIKGQVDLYKKEIDDLHTKIDQQMNKITKYEYDLNIAQSKVSALTREKENLLAEKDQLLEQLDELRCNPAEQISGNTVSSELLTSSTLKEKLERLEAENKALREGNGGQTALADLLHDANQRAEKLREQLKEANQKILVLEGSPTSTSTTKDEADIESKYVKETKESQVASLSNKVTNLEAALAAKTQELTANEMRYKKLLEKAKEVIKSMDPTVPSPNEEEKAGVVDEGHAPMSQLEERLIVSAYYNLGLQCQRDAIDTRLALLNSPGQSFLARQRQPAPRKPMNVNYSKK
ncbi:protein hook [Culicoides brevitarsis]|uniref:protein hook n=1 Tax=Culicoides brevitarsis TaxID=469753 RepID=UPI00307C142A